MDGWMFVEWKNKERQSEGKGFTNDGEINFHVPRRRVAEVHSAPVDTLVRQLDVVDEELGRMGRRSEIRAIRKSSRRGPQFRFGHVSCPHVEATGDNCHELRVHCK